MPKYSQDVSVTVDVEFGDFNPRISGPETMTFGGYSVEDVKKMVRDYTEYVCKCLDQIDKD